MPEFNEVVTLLVNDGGLLFGMACLVLAERGFFIIPAI